MIIPKDAMIFYDNKQFIISGNTAFFLPADYPHEYYPNEEQWDIHWVVFGGTAITQTISNISMDRPGIYKLHDTSRMELLFFAMHDTLSSKELFSTTRASGILYSFLLEFNRLTVEKSYGTNYNPILKKAVNYITEHYA